MKDFNFENVLILTKALESNKILTSTNDLKPDIVLQPPTQAGNIQQVFNESVVFNSFNPFFNASSQQWVLFAREGVDI